MYFFLSQSAMLFGDRCQSLATSVGETETDVRIISEVDAARMARFPVNLTPNVGRPGGRRGGGECAYRIEYVDCLTVSGLVSSAGAWVWAGRSPGS